jgi:hypothetical protein
MGEAEWELLSVFMYIEGMRKEPIMLRHVKSHTQAEDPIAVGNAAADMVAEAARLFAPHKPLYAHSPFLPPLTFHKVTEDKTSINTNCVL